MNKTIALAAIVASTVEGHSGYGRPDFGQFASPNPYSQLNAFRELISANRSMVSLALTQYQNEIDHRDRLIEMTTKMNRYEATSMLYSDSYFSTTYTGSGYTLCLNKGETVEIMM